MTFSSAELERYSRQIVLKEIGTEGQKKLKNARVCIAGVGGLGCISALQLAAIGVGYIRLVDQDVVDLTNLHRQPIYDVPSIGYPKVEVAEKKLKSLNPNVETDLLTSTVNSNTAESVVEGVDIVVDGLDRFGPRYALNKACLKLKVPYIFGGAIETYGNVSTIVPRETACLECIMGRMNDEHLPTCEIVGVLPPVLGIVASIQVREAISLILGRKPSLANKLLFCNLNSTSFEVFSTARSPNCTACGKPAEKVAEELRVVELCGKNSFMISSKDSVLLDMVKVNEILGNKFKIKIQARYGITLDYSDDISVSLMKTGNMLVKGVKNKKEALQLYDEVMNCLVD
ncbi:MAG: HesA/MoeB/ThiF family protein [Candidatus Korarchaeota archaeon]|nr:HesA/MoeB/ThiF family protein [Candidatus Korarchaeota archaeon]